MMNRPNPTLIGLFVLSALALGIVAIMFVGGRGFSEQSVRFILYFEGNVKGLNVGAPVTFRGVHIGQVESVSVLFDEQSLRVDIPVVISVDMNKVGISRKIVPEKDGKLVEELIKKGLRASLTLQSLVTGQLQVELGFHPDTRVRLMNRQSDYRELPTIVTGMEKIARTLEDLPLEEITQTAISILNGIEKIVNGADFPAMAQQVAVLVGRLERLSKQLEEQTPELMESSLQMTVEIRQAVAELRQQTGPLLKEWTQVAQDSRQLVAQADGSLQRALASWDKTMASGDAAFVKASDSFESAENLVKSAEPLNGEIKRALQELSAAAHSISIWADYLERHPEALIRGKQ
ncbi:MlaD family protein [Candidatus Endoriftia persephone]|jgi:paraquat-inducible protein B|uniref:Mce/MlaD domain-containing protein n=3 Tax=Gammaproteobacteria TaxID=1236 RepID=G2FD41_9GAMM|nr:MlaD family protein [Candidatus Endoriftia persephone]EGV49967.1 paraquat-inducible protein B [endosymbiont of Riftia pachyptila (vent Ph05)]EGW55421.1 hypothetical protein TevJSym_ad01550 [endosymbiont of Tevnia jerichonana (vent Tica)]USF88929.1 MlaD family protein [Candidatus Endoriftia persephone]